MRLCDFLRHFEGNFTFKLYKDDVMFREDVLDYLKQDCKQSFNILSGFDCELWEMKVGGWAVTDNIIYVELQK